MAKITSLKIILEVLMLVLATSTSSILGTVSEAICEGHGERPSCKNPDEWISNGTQNRILKTFKYDVFEHGSGSFCVPFDIETGKNRTITVFSYFACNYGQDLGFGRYADEKRCHRCRNRSIKCMVEGFPNCDSALMSSVYCCLRLIKVIHFITSAIKMIMLHQHSVLIMPLLVLLVLATSCTLRVTSTISNRVCFGPYDDMGTKCDPFQWSTNATQERILNTFKYDVFEHGSGSFCVPFDIKTGKNQTLTVYGYFACNEGGSVDEKACVRCRNRGIRALRAQCRNRVGAVVISEHCCLSGSFCVPFDINIAEINETQTVFSYFACNYGDSVDERACNRCRNRGIRALRARCRNRDGAVARSEHCCLRYETYNMCTNHH
ncbi:hypothetical protein LINGRAHAP2_LOCUS8834 [Linum grandiflorum]